MCAEFFEDENQEFCILDVKIGWYKDILKPVQNIYLKVREDWSNYIVWTFCTSTIWTF